jgi:hypothetical protein
MCHTVLYAPNTATTMQWEMNDYVLSQWYFTELLHPLTTPLSAAIQ